MQVKLGLIKKDNAIPWFTQEKIKCDIHYLALTRAKRVEIQGFLSLNILKALQTRLGISELLWAEKHLEDSLELLHWIWKAKPHRVFSFAF